MMSKHSRLLTVSLALFAFAAGAEQVVRVKDGDSIVIASGDGQVDVRLADIDAPEYRQRRGEEARAALQGLVAGKDVKLQLIGGDVYRRIVAHVFIDGVHVNAEMVRLGLAWVRRAYDPPAHLVRGEDEARTARRGLWADANPTAPWDWRKNKRSARSTEQAGARVVRGGRHQSERSVRPTRQTRTAQATPKSCASAAKRAIAPRVSCGTKRWCREMSSCIEAIAFLNQCGVDTIDGDNDGIPCEAICNSSC